MKTAPLRIPIAQLAQNAHLLGTADSLITGDQNERHFLHLMRHKETESLHIPFPKMFTSPLMTSSSYKDRFHVFAELYPKYSEAYVTVCRQIDAMLQYAPIQPVPLQELLYTELQIRGCLISDIRRHHAECGERRLDNYTFRQIAMASLIRMELLRIDSVGTAMYTALASVREAYCASLDQQAHLRAQLGLEEGVSSIEYVAEIIEWKIYAVEHPLHGLIDYSKSPFVAFGLIHNKGAPYPAIRTHISLLPSVDCSGSSELKHLTQTAEIKELIYQAGDELHGTKRQFGLSQFIIAATPAVYWSKQVPRRGRFLWKVLHLIIAEKRNAQPEVSEEEMQRRAQLWQETERVKRSSSLYWPPDKRVEQYYMLVLILAVFMVCLLYVASFVFG